MTAAPGPQQPDELRRALVASWLWDEFGDTDSVYCDEDWWDQRAADLLARLDSPPAPSAQPDEVCAANEVGWCTTHGQAHWRCPAQPDEVRCTSACYSMGSSTWHAEGCAYAAVMPAQTTADRLAGWLNDHPELTGVTDGTRFVGDTPAQPVRDAGEGRR